jgi:hypothetical protein
MGLAEERPHRGRRYSHHMSGLGGRGGRAREVGAEAERNAEADAVRTWYRCRRSARDWSVHRRRLVTGQEYQIGLQRRVSTLVCFPPP